MRLFIVEMFGRGGMIHYTYQLSTALAQQGVDVTLVTAREYEMESRFPHNFAVEKRLNMWPYLNAKSTPPRNQLNRIWGQTRWTARRGLRAVRLIREWHRLTTYLIAQRPDVIQFGKINFPFEALFLARLRRNGLVLTQICHEFELRERNKIVGNLVNNLYANVYNNFSVLFFHAQNNRQRFSSLFDVPGERLRVIPLGNGTVFPTTTDGAITEAQLRQRYGLGTDDPVVLFFGILSPSKGLPDLLQAFALAHQQPCRAKLVVAGFPSKYMNLNDLQDMTSALGISEKVVFDARYIPFEEVGPLMELATAVVYPYRNSTQSASLQVAYAFGRPVIATNVGGLPEVVEDGRSGILVPPQAPQQLAEAINKMLNNPQMSTQMGAYARHLSETRYSWTPIAKQVLAAYRNLTS
ncbi:MAG: glycosyltransferase family 4 protein [Ardenticatenaceae bacterium]